MVDRLVVSFRGGAACAGLLVIAVLLSGCVAFAGGEDGGAPEQFGQAVEQTAIDGSIVDLLAEPPNGPSDYDGFCLAVGQVEPGSDGYGRSEGYSDVAAVCAPDSNALYGQFTVGTNKYIVARSRTPRDDGGRGLGDCARHFEYQLEDVSYGYWCFLGDGS